MTGFGQASQQRGDCIGQRRVYLPVRNVPYAVDETGHPTMRLRLLKGLQCPLRVAAPRTPTMTLVRGKRSWSCRTRVMAPANANGGRAEMQKMSAACGSTIPSRLPRHSRALRKWAPSGLHGFLSNQIFAGGRRLFGALMNEAWRAPKGGPGYRRHQQRQGGDPRSVRLKAPPQ